jgi:hypothetical protein
MRYALTAVILVSVAAGYGWAEEWKEYHRDASTIQSCKNITAIPDTNHKNVETLTRIGDECIYNYYEIDCDKKRWKQMQRAMSPCGKPFLLKPGEQKWHSLDRLGLFRPDKKRLITTVCGEE